ncbi:MAG: RCC1 domain-containing protein [Proteobacteria bacterium]|nr:RCC1 domain-containing protein [Pseudomonadota bacterium]
MKNIFPKSVLANRFIITFAALLTCDIAFADNVIHGSSESFLGFLGNEVVSLSANNQICAVTKNHNPFESQISCWGGANYPPPSSDGVATADLVSVGGTFACLVGDSSHIRCSGNPSYVEIFGTPHGFGEIVAMSSSHWRICALGHTSAWCNSTNGDAYRMESLTRSLRNPKSIAANNTGFCAIDDDGLRCWDNRPIRDELKPAPVNFRNPSAVASSAYISCAIDGNAVRCWALDDSFANLVPVEATLQHPRSLSVGWGHVCAIDDFGAHCWGLNDHGQINVPSHLSNPSLITAGDFKTCAVDLHGVHCWGALEQLDVPAGLTNGFRHGWAKKLAQFTYGDKLDFLRRVQSSLLDHLSDLSYENQVQSLTVWLISNWVRDIDSAAFQTQIIPLWNQQLSDLSLRTAVNMPGEIPKGPETLSAALNILNDALLSAKTYLPASIQGDVDVLAVEIGSLLALPVISEADAREAIDHLQLRPSLLRALSQSDRLHPTSLVVNGVIQWITQ